MQIFLALYDPGSPPRDGLYWTWRSPTLSNAVLDRFFYDIANKHRPSRPNLLAANHLWGGAARISDKYVAVYRFADGGLDCHDRTGRYVLMAAFASANETIGMDLTPLLLLPDFERIVRTARSERPVSPPANLDIELDARQLSMSP